MLVYDITNTKSFDNISKWLRNIEEVYRVNKPSTNKLKAYLSFELFNFLTRDFFFCVAKNIALIITFQQY